MVIFPPFLRNVTDLFGSLELVVNVVQLLGRAFVRTREVQGILRVRASVSRAVECFIRYFSIPAELLRPQIIPPARSI